MAPNRARNAARTGSSGRKCRTPGSRFRLRRPATVAAQLMTATARETRMVVEPDSAGEIRPGSKSRAEAAWKSTALRLHFNRDFQINS